MTTEIPKQYDPAAAEAKWLPFWEERGDFNADPPAPGEANPKPPHVIMIPLPNVTGALHMGHALNGTLQDLLTRWRRMQGYEALWMSSNHCLSALAMISGSAVMFCRMM